MDDPERFRASANRIGIFGLPLELRLLIYGYLVGRGVLHLSVAISVDVHNGTLQYSREPRVSLHPAILRVSRQTYDEAVSTLYAGCVFSPVADEQVISAFFGRMSEHARAHVVRLELTPRRGSGRSVPGPSPNMPQIQLVPLWSPACDAIAALLPDLREVRIHLGSFNMYGLRTGQDVSWILAPLSRLGGVRKTLVVESNSRVGAEESSAPVERWNMLMAGANREQKEYTIVMARVQLDRSGWPELHWRTKRTMRRMGIFPGATVMG